MLQLLLLLVGALLACVRSRRDVALENLVLRHQLQVALRTNASPRLRDPDRILWVWLRRLWPAGWREHLLVVQPATVLRWHRQGWRLYWSWKSRTNAGRPRLGTEVKELIAQISSRTCFSAISSGRVADQPASLASGLWIESSRSLFPARLIGEIPGRSDDWPIAISHLERGLERSEFQATREGGPFDHWYLNLSNLTSHSRPSTTATPYP